MNAGDYMKAGKPKNSDQQGGMKKVQERALGCDKHVCKTQLI